MMARTASVSMMSSSAIAAMHAGSPVIHHCLARTLCDSRRRLETGDGKLIGPTANLYDLATDPGETQNVIAEQPAVAAQLVEKITNIVTSGRSTPGSPVSNDTGHWSDLTWIEN